MGNSTQKEQLKLIGSRLGEERQRKSISLEEIAAKTYIPQRLLSAIEDANLDRLPEPVFIQGFIRRFADAIGLDGTAVSKEFTVDLSPLPAPTAANLISSSVEPVPLKPVVQQSIPPKSIARQSIPAKAVASIPQTPNPQSLEPVIVRDQPKLSPNVSLENEAPNRLPLIALGAAIGLGVLGVLAASFFNRPAERPAPIAAAPTLKPVQPAKSPAPQTKSPAAASPAPAGAIGVKMNVSEDSWVEVTVDGASVFEGTLPKGTQRSWSGKQQVVVNAGNAGGVALSYNNATFKPMGAAGEVQSAAFPPTP